MSQYAATLEFNHVTQGAQSPGSIANGAEASAVGSFLLVADPNGGAGVAVLLPELWGHELISAELLHTIDGNAVRTFGGATWLANLAAGNSLVVNAAGESTLNSWTTLTGPPVTRLPRPFVLLSGAALAAMGWAVGDTVLYRVTYRRSFPEASAPTLGTLYLDTALSENPTNATSFLRRVEGMTQGGIVQIVGVPAGYLANCTLVANDPGKVLFVAPSDIGANASTQVPTLLSQNSAAGYMLFPSVFVMRGQQVAGVRLVETRTDDLTTAPGQLAILRVDRAPTHSRWEVSMRGTRHDVIVAHPVNSDLRTAKAAFAACWAGYLGGTAVGQGPVTFRRIAGGGTFAPAGVLNNCAQIDALRFIEPLDSNGNIWSVYYQT